MTIAERRTPSLWGAGLIDTVPDDVLRKVEAQQARSGSGVRGTLARATGGGVGKFGWRGQTATLKQFVIGACANELGLRVPGVDQPLDPLDTKHASPGFDLTDEQCQALVAFVASLPPPRARQRLTPRERESFAEGRQLFHRTGCAECHVPALGEVSGIYSDLLLHDMGTELADQASANPPNMVATVVSPAYYGGPTDVFVDVPPETRRQWRTPPLWGVTRFAPYLHDGRAATLEAAIELHAGEARTAQQRYFKLPPEKRESLIAFLGAIGYED
jgi:CxxC motif-containing protein (DUF1111 family)